MSAWVESESYTGPCRRARRRGLRLVERRRDDRSAPEPSLQQLIRRLRVHEIAIGCGSSRRRFRERLAPVIALARSRGQDACAQELSMLKALLDRAPASSDVGAMVATSLDRAAAEIQ